MTHRVVDTRLACCDKVLPVCPELVSRHVGSNRVAVSPVVTLEPRRRKFHQPVLLTVPLPKAFQRGMINQYSSSGGTSPPNLRLLCSVFGTPSLPPGKSG